jgi:hypothetical protein
MYASLWVENPLLWNKGAMKVTGTNLVPRDERQCRPALFVLRGIGAALEHT